MGIRKKHLSEGELRAIRRGRTPDMLERMHISACSRCRRDIADALIIEQLSRAQGGVSSGAHAASFLIEQFHEAAYEAQDMQAEPFLRVYEHLKECDQCFASFLALHDKTTPSAELVEKVTDKFVARLPKRNIGRIVFRRVADGIEAAFRPGRKRSVKPRNQLGRILSSFGLEQSSLSEPGLMKARGMALSRLSPPITAYRMISANSMVVGKVVDDLVMPKEVGVPARLLVGHIAVSLLVRLEEGKVDARVQAEDLDSGVPRPGLTIQEVDIESGQLSAATTDETGVAVFPIQLACRRLLFREGVTGEPFELELNGAELYSLMERIRAERELAILRAKAEEAERLAREEHIARREARTAAWREILESIGGLPPEEQIACIAAVEELSIYMFEDLLVSVPDEAYQRVPRASLERLQLRLQRVSRGPLKKVLRVVNKVLKD